MLYNCIAIEDICASGIDMFYVKKVIVSQYDFPFVKTLWKIERTLLHGIQAGNGNK